MRSQLELAWWDVKFTFIGAYRAFRALFLLPRKRYVARSEAVWLKWERANMWDWNWNPCGPLLCNKDGEMLSCYHFTGSERSGLEMV